MSSTDLLKCLADDLASVIPSVDAIAEHDRWQAGLGPFEEEEQLERLQQTVAPSSQYSVDTEEPYPENGQRCDLLVGAEDTQIPIEAKLLRFRYDNGNVDPNSFARIFSPFPEQTSSSLLTDAQKLHDSSFEHSGGLLGLYYQPVDEEYDEMSAESIAEKFCLDLEYWYGLEVETRNVAHFEGLRHPVHQQGAVIMWELV